MNIICIGGPHDGWKADDVLGRWIIFEPDVKYEITPMQDVAGRYVAVPVEEEHVPAA